MHPGQCCCARWLNHPGELFNGRHARACGGAGVAMPSLQRTHCRQTDATTQFNVQNSTPTKPGQSKNPGGPGLGLLVERNVAGFGAP